MRVKALAMFLNVVMTFSPLAPTMVAQNGPPAGRPPQFVLGPFTWNAAYSPPTGVESTVEGGIDPVAIDATENATCDTGDCPTLLSQLTPVASITIVRVEYTTQQTPRVPGPHSDNACTPAPRIILSNGTTTYALPINNGKDGEDGPLKPNRTDSGPLALKFGTGVPILMSHDVGGDANNHCHHVPGNVTVQYTIP